MAVRLSAAEIDFLKRVRDYCADGLNQVDMAKAEATSLTSFRFRLFRCGFTIESATRRDVVRTGSGEALGDLLETGQIVAREPEDEACMEAVA